MDLVKSDNQPVGLSVIDPAFLQLAKEMGINLEALSETNSINSGNSTNRVSYTDLSEKLRYYKPNGADEIKWLLPGQEEYHETFEDQGLPRITKIRGVIVHAEMSGGLQKKAKEAKADDMGKTICSIMGYYSPTHKGVVVGLPGEYAIKSMYGEYDNEARQYITTIPHPVVENAQLMGTRGESCADCIRRGHSTIEEDAINLASSCKLMGGKMWMYVTDLFYNKVIPPKDAKSKPTTSTTHKTVQELLGESGVIIQIHMSGSLGIRGRWDENEENRRTGYSSYLNQLAISGKKGGVVSHPYLVSTCLSLKPPITGDVNTKWYLNFESDRDHTSIDLIRQAMMEWRKVNPSAGSVTMMDLNRRSTVNPITESAITVDAKAIWESDAVEILPPLEEEDSVFG